jgi:hypothetical protein
VRVAAADRDRPNAHIPVIDVPAFLAGIGRSAAGEFGHPPSNCGIERVGKPSYSLSLKIRAEWYAETAIRMIADAVQQDLVALMRISVRSAWSSNCWAVRWLS